VCGIAGFAGPPNAAVFAAMRDALAHRGPDGSGGFSDDRVSLGHRRLAIVDVAGGAQPIFNEDRSIILVFNGEIYNHAHLRQRLASLGHRYVSNCDAESIVHAYEAHGTACVEQFNGMFAFVLYDSRRKLLFGARDRMGEKPLYYTSRPFGDIEFAFASEPKALRRCPDLRQAFELSPDALVSYLLHDYSLGPQTIAAGVQQLPPGFAFTYGLAGSLPFVALLAAQLRIIRRRWKQVP
jgi:asparagine synthase (glutamine-hydrolysing)